MMVVDSMVNLEIIGIFSVNEKDVMVGFYEDFGCVCVVIVQNFILVNGIKEE